MTFLIRALMAIIFLSSCSSFKVDYTYFTPLIESFSEKPNLVDLTTQNTNASFIKITYKNREAIFILSEIIDGKLFKWVGSNSEELVTLNGLIVSTSGLDFNFSLYQPDINFLQDKFPIGEHSIRANLKNPELNFVPITYTGKLVNRYLGSREVEVIKEIKDIGWQSYARIKYLNEYPQELHQRIHPFSSKITIKYYFRF